MRTLRTTFLACLVLCSIAAACLGQEAGTWALTTADFQERRGELVSLDADGVTLRSADGSAAKVAADQVVSLDRIAATPGDSTGDDFLLHLRGGERLRGTPTSLGEAALTMRTAALGEVSVPLESLVALTRPTATSRPPSGAAPAADEITLANGDRLTGFLSSINGETWTVQDAGGAATPVDPTTVARVRFADAGLPPAGPPEGWRLRLVDGSEVVVPGVSFDGETFAFSYNGKGLGIPASRVAGVDRAGGPVLFLGELTPTLDEQTPYFSADFPTRPTRRGFVVRSRSVLRFDVPEGYSKLRVAYRLSDNAPRGDAAVRVLLDDRVAHERPSLTAGVRPEPVVLPLDGAKSVTLEVGYGGGLDVQDQVEWLDPALLR